MVEPVEVASVVVIKVRQRDIHNICMQFAITLELTFPDKLHCRAFIAFSEALELFFCVEKLFDFGAIYRGRISLFSSGGVIPNDGRCVQQSYQKQRHKDPHHSCPKENY